MAWAVAAVRQDQNGGEFVLSEEAAAASKTLVWGTDAAAGLSPKGGSIIDGSAEITGVRVELATGAASTARHIVIQVLDSADDVVMETESAVDFSTAASSRVYEFARGFSPASAGIELIATIGTIVRAPLPADLAVMPGAKLKVFDKNAADATDVLTVHVRGRVIRT